MPPPYRSTRELPEPVRHALPLHAQQIFLEAVNHAWEQNREPEARRTPGETREVVAFKAAWKAVEQAYGKDPVTIPGERRPD